MLWRAGTKTLLSKSNLEQGPTTWGCGATCGFLTEEKHKTFCIFKTVTYFSGCMVHKAKIYCVFFLLLPFCCEKKHILLCCFCPCFAEIKQKNYLKWIVLKQSLSDCDYIKFKCSFLCFMFFCHLKKEFTLQLLFAEQDNIKGLRLH